MENSTHRILCIPFVLGSKDKKPGINIFKDPGFFGFQKTLDGEMIARCWSREVPS